MQLGAIEKQLPGCVLWRTKCELRYELIRTKGLLVVGGDGIVTAYSTTDGKEVWRGAVQGRAFGLTAADDRLFVSTDEGVIHCFTGGSR